MQQIHILLVDDNEGDILLTREALALYRRHLQPGGIVVFHVSNQYINLEPVVAGIASDAGLRAVSVHTLADEQTGLYYADWILVTANQAFLNQPEILNNGFPTPLKSEVRVWTDNYSSVFPLLKWFSR